MGGEQDFQCSICHDHVRIPVCTKECGHWFCRDCILTLPRDDPEGQHKVQCPICRGAVDVNKLIDVMTEASLRPLKNALLEEEVSCQFVGCSWKGKYSARDGHERECPEEPIKCNLCDGVFKRKEKHHSQDVDDPSTWCKQAQVLCSFCNRNKDRWIGTFGDYSTTHQPICKYVEEKCDGCDHNFMRKDHNFPVCRLQKRVIDLEKEVVDQANEVKKIDPLEKQVAEMRTAMDAMRKQLENFGDRRISGPERKRKK